MSQLIERENNLVKEPLNVTWKKEYPDGITAKFEPRSSPVTGYIVDDVLIFFDEKGCCLSWPEYPSEDIFERTIFCNGYSRIIECSVCGNRNLGYFESVWIYGNCDHDFSRYPGTIKTTILYKIMR